MSRKNIRGVRLRMKTANTGKVWLKGKKKRKLCRISLTGGKVMWLSGSLIFLPFLSGANRRLFIWWLFWAWSAFFQIIISKRCRPTVCFSSILEIDNRLCAIIRVCFLPCLQSQTHLATHRNNERSSRFIINKNFARYSHLGSPSRNLNVPDVRTHNFPTD